MLNTAMIAANYPAAPYTVQSNSVFAMPVNYTDLSAAAVCLAARRKNSPVETHSVLDADGYIVPRPALERALEIAKAQAAQVLAAAL